MRLWQAQPQLLVKLDISIAEFMSSIFTTLFLVHDAVKQTQRLSYSLTFARAYFQIDVQTIAELGQDDPYSVIFDKLRYDPLLFAFRLIQEAISNVSISGSWDFLPFRIE